MGQRNIGSVPPKNATGLDVIADIRRVQRKATGVNCSTGRRIHILKQNDSRKSKEGVLFPSCSQIALCRECLLSGQCSRKTQDTAVKKNLTELEINPIPYEENFEGSEGSDEGEDVG